MNKKNGLLKLRYDNRVRKVFNSFKVAEELWHYARRTGKRHPEIQYVYVLVSKRIRINGYKTPSVLKYVFRTVGVSVNGKSLPDLRLRGSHQNYWEGCQSMEDHLKGFIIRIAKDEDGRLTTLPD